jgi:hypothetical protein
MRQTYSLRNDGDVGTQSIEVKSLGGETVVKHVAFGEDTAKQGEGKSALATSCASN